MPVQHVPRLPHRHGLRQHMPCHKRPATGTAARPCRPLLLLPLCGHAAGRTCAAAALRGMRLRPAAEARWLAGCAHAATRRLLLLPLLVRLLPRLHLSWPSRPLVLLRCRPRRLLRCNIVLPPELRVGLVLQQRPLRKRRSILLLHLLPWWLTQLLWCRLLLLLLCRRLLLVGRDRPPRAGGGVNRQPCLGIVVHICRERLEH